MSSMLRSSSARTRFQNRGKEILRIEALSDAVFAFAVSLLAVSLEVPQNFHEMKFIISGALPFFATVALLFLFWYQQYVFFRHYGLSDLTTILLNLAYVAVLIFYLYPLKFLFSLLLGSWMGIDLFPKATESGLAVISYADFPLLITIFSIGYVVIWWLLWAMHQHALHAALKLSAYETEVTLAERRGALMNMLVGLTAIVLVWLGWSLMSGVCYLSIPAWLFFNQRLLNRRLRKLPH